tara:strand:- start:35 stop:265 length:231 start_codon:yes stop_codon:yes gene_type:complete
LGRQRRRLRHDAREFRFQIRLARLGHVLRSRRFPLLTARPQVEYLGTLALEFGQSHRRRLRRWLRLRHRGQRLVEH